MGPPAIAGGFLLTKTSQLHEAIGMNKPHANKALDCFLIYREPWVTAPAPDTAPKQVDSLEKTWSYSFCILYSVQDARV